MLPWRNSFIWCDCDIYWFVIQIRSDTMSTDSLDIKELYLSACCLQDTSSTCFQQHLILGSGFITSQNNIIIICSAQQVTLVAIQLILVLNIRGNIICFLLMTAPKVFKINLTHMVKQPFSHPSFKRHGSGDGNSLVGVQRMNPADFGEHLTFHLAPPWCCHLSTSSEIAMEFTADNQSHQIIHSKHFSDPLIFL